ncbi:hypothetical protein FIBSPDRAFT_875686 [Athelia psychrophila]|uniref:Glycosyltransferase family 18 catalytic domain-containing protein n=1 Tax=Athelia psychrophila TaxID=1759441 RepID=A0A167XJL3_9AGAM|nr:hypothetical protein FIBSPDRAFT_875686 [Fibularhizoctonia sp. CBS 109695]
MLPLYQAFPSHVRAALADNPDLESCLSSSESPSPLESPCGQSASFPSGIPSYKVFAFTFWPRAAHPFGAQWTLSPEDYKALGDGANTYLGYSVEATCKQHPFVPHAERSANEAYILAKLLSFFLPERDRAWTPEMLNEATRATGIAYISGSTNDTQTRDGPAPQEPAPMWAVPELPEKYTNEGRRPQFEFLERLAEMRVLIGMGNPITSPTPYDALCLGVPFINPILFWDSENPADRSHWWTQHAPLSRLDPPYVYNVFANDLEGFVSAIKGAVDNPIQSFVLDDMKIQSVERRLHAILQHDWDGEATRLGWSSKLQ